jgi:ubiquinone biosynthesis UbiH/UbiF/VisC/COQ6 family hydroxylase
MQKIAILGLGLNGMVASILSKQAGFDITIFEEHNLNNYKNDKRTSVLTFKSLQFFKTLGVFDELEKFLSPIFHIYTFEGQKSPVLSLDASDVSANPIGFVVHNYDLKKILLDKIQSLDIKIISKKATYVNTESFIKVSYADAQEDFKLLLNCGGMGFATKEFHFPYNQTAFVFNILHKEDHKTIAVESFAPQGPLAILPLNDKNQSAVIWTLKNDTAKFLKQLKDEDFLSHFKFASKRMGHIGEVVNIISDIKTYSLTLSFEKSQVKDRTILLGDSFNTIHPVAGSSFNMSLKDMQKLYLYLLECKRLGLDVGSFSGLQSFARGNIFNHLQMNAFTHLLVKMFSNSNPLVHSVRSFGVEAIESISPLKAFLLKKTSGI